MGHDANQVLMGSTKSTDNVSENFDANPVTFPAGTAVRMKSDNAISVTKADGQLLGVSLGESLSNTKKLSVARSGLGIPLKLTSGFVPVVGEFVYIDDATGLGQDSEETATLTAAIYKSGPLDAVAIDGTVTADIVAYIDMPGGL